MSQKSFSLILGGGAARGLAHIGLIRRIEELELSPSLVVGTSMGALIGAFYACGYSSHEIEKIAVDTSLIKLLDIDFKKGGIKGEKIIHFLEKYLGTKQFSETTIPLKIIATNIDTGKKIVYSEGSIIDAIRASISIPGLFAPVISGTGEHLIDGGIVANLPIEEALPGLPVIALSVQMWEMFRDEEKISALFGKGFFTSGYHILRRTIQLMMIKNEEQSYQMNPEALFLSLKRDDIEYYDFQKLTELIDEGYRVAASIPDYLSP